jgi:hypothetical protein
MLECEAHLAEVIRCLSGSPKLNCSSIYQRHAVQDLPMAEFEIPVMDPTSRQAAWRVPQAGGGIFAENLQERGVSAAHFALGYF